MAYCYAVRRQRNWDQKRRRFEEALHRSESHLRAIVQSEPECIKTVDARGNLTEMNPAGLAMIEAASLDQVKGHPVADLIVPEYRKAFADLHARVMAGQSAQLEFEIIGLKGGRRWLETHAVPLQEGGETVQLALTRDITQRKSMEDQVRQLAFHDHLTGLPNRRLLLDRLNQAMAASRRSGRYAAIIFLDLDHFKPLNDTHGHEVGDLLLTEVADRLARCVREIDTVARFGGDEFVVMLSDLHANKDESIAQAQAIAEKIRVALAEPYHMTVKHGESPPVTVVHRCSASIGVALFIDHQGSADDVLSWADGAMYAAKEAGRNRVRFHAMGSHQDRKVSGTDGLPP
jgi:diguanylate cyclase (GGDEF)-like protein/PAS domain S-box-containing protein